MKIYQSNLLKKFKNITHAFTSKDGGISQAPYATLNLAFHVGDKNSDIEYNHQLLAQKLNYNKDSLIHMKQIHSSKVHIIEKNDTFDNPKECDALITNKKNIPLMVMVADCAPVLFYDPFNEVIAVAHAGRAGAFQNIVKNVLDIFVQKYNSEVKNIYVSVGANIQQCCYEVGSEIAHEVKQLQIEYALKEQEKSFFLSINAILQKQLLKEGVRKEHIEFADECTCCNNKKYFSYRAHGVTGRFCGIIYLNKGF